MKINTHTLSRRTLTGCLIAAVSSALISLASAQISPEARELARAVAKQLDGADAIHLVASHKIDPAIGVGEKFEKGPIEIHVKRPNRFHALQRAGGETREIAYDGRQLCLMHPELKHHALVPLRASSIGQFGDRLDSEFGFRPPLGELLSGDLVGQLFLHVTSAKIEGEEWVGFTPCQRLHFEQKGMSGDLWIAKKDKLPRKYRLTFTDVAGNPTWEIRLKQWELNGPVDDRLFSKRPAADSQKVDLLRSR